LLLSPWTHEMKLPTIDGKEIIPIRLIPAIAGINVQDIFLLCMCSYHWHGKPELKDIIPRCPAVLARDIYINGGNKRGRCHVKIGFSSYHLHLDGNWYKMQPETWNKYFEKHRTEYHSLSNRLEIDFIPARSFVWKDEFEAFSMQVPGLFNNEGDKISYTAYLTANEFVCIYSPITKHLSKQILPTDNTPSTSQRPYLDPKHRHYSHELAVAVEIWLELYDGGKFIEKRAHREQIKAALATKEELTGKNSLSNAAIERIATLVNPNKNGGAPTIG